MADEDRRRARKLLAYLGLPCNRLQAKARYGDDGGRILERFTGLVLEYRREVVDAERERCAAIAANWTPDDPLGDGEDIAAGIRAPNP